jgi:hypothetical protein
MGRIIEVDVRTGRRTERDFTPEPPPPVVPREPPPLETLRAEFDALKAALVAKGVV